MRSGRRWRRGESTNSSSAARASWKTCFQPKNDRLLFAYFGIALQPRRRGVATSLRSEIAKRKQLSAMIGDDADRDGMLVLLRDPDRRAVSVSASGGRAARALGSHTDGAPAGQPRIRRFARSSAPYSLHFCEAPLTAGTSSLCAVEPRACTPLTDSANHTRSSTPLTPLWRAQLAQQYILPPASSADPIRWTGWLSCSLAPGS